MATKRNIILTLVAVLATIISVQGQQVDVEQSKITVLEGEQVAVLCGWGQPLQYCRIQIPGVPNALNLSPKYNRTPGFTYYGSGLENGQCGVTIDQVRGEYNGNIECFLGAEGTEFAGTVELTVARVPLTPEIAIVDNQGNAINTPGPFQVGQRIRATCISRDGRPASAITWYLDGHQLTDGLGQLETIESQHHSGQTLITTSQAIDLEIRADYDGRLLICSTENLATRGKTQDIKVPITVIYPPQPLPKQEIFGLVLGQSNLINITFRSNPPPRVAWIIDGQTIEEGRRYERYEVYQSIPYGQGYVNATLGIADLNIEDTSKTYTLRASNEFGSQEYTVRLSSAERAPDTGLGMGSIIGIVLGVAVILIIIAVVVIARITGKWCFSDNAGKTTTETGPIDDADRDLLSSPSPEVLAAETQRYSMFYDASELPPDSPLPSENQRSATESPSTSLGIPQQSSPNRWLPSQQRELLERQAELLIRTNSKKETDIF